MAAQNLDSADLKNNANGVLIREDVMDQIWDISAIPLPFTDRAGDHSPDQEYTEWTVDRLRDPDLDNKNVDGADTEGNDTNLGARMGNHCQISTKVVRVSTRANASDTIGRDNELEYQLMMRLRELKRDKEAIALSLQGSVEDDGDTVPGETGSVFSFIKTNASVGATGSVPGFDQATKLTGDVVPGTARPLTETMVRDSLQAAYELGGDPYCFMARPGVVRKFSEYSFTSSARIGTLVTETGDSRDGSVVAKGAVNVWQTDFGITIELVPNRLMQPSAANTSSIGLFDFQYLAMGNLWGERTEALAKTGTAENRQIAVDWCVVVKNEESQAAIHAIDETAPVTLS